MKIKISLAAFLISSQLLLGAASLQAAPATQGTTYFVTDLPNASNNYTLPNPLHVGDQVVVQFHNSDVFTGTASQAGGTGTETTTTWNFSSLDGTSLVQNTIANLTPDSLQLKNHKYTLFSSSFTATASGTTTLHFQSQASTQFYNTPCHVGFSETDITITATVE